jgi:hypothetical protein
MSKPVTEIKHISVNDNSFVANGQKYIVRSDLTVKRFEVFERLQIEMTYGVTFKELFDKLTDAYSCLQSFKIADACVIIYNILKGISRKNEERKHPALLLCTLFLCRENENLAEWTEADAIEKIMDWEKEGISSSDFFQLAFRSVHGYTGSWSENSQDTSNKTGTQSPN